MNNSEIRSRAFEIYKANIVPLLAVNLATTALSALDNKIENTVLSLLITIAGTVISVGICYFIIRTWTDGSANISNIAVPFTQPVYRKKIIPIMVAETGIILLAATPVVALIFANRNNPTFFIMSWVFILLLLLLIVIAGVAISLVWYIYIIEPELKVSELFKKSASYMSRHWGDYLWFSLTISLVPAIITALFTGKIDRAVLSLLLVPAQAYISIARTGFVYERILLVEQAKENPVAVTAQTDEHILPPVEETLPEPDTETQQNNEET